MTMSLSLPTRFPPTPPVGTIGDDGGLAFSGGTGDAESAVAGVSYRDLLNRIDHGFCIIEMQFDAQEKPADYRFLEVNAAFENQTGLKNATGRTMRSFAPEHEDYWFEIYGRVALSGESARFELPAEKLGRFYDVHAFRVGPAHLRRVAVVFSDISKRKREEHRLALVSAEVDHRAKNLFAMVSSMIRLTKAETVGEFREKLSGRVASLVRSHQLLATTPDADLEELVEWEMDGFRAEGGHRIAWSGPAVRLPRQAAQSVLLVLHELATNALKYGALSTRDGRLDLSWSWGEQGQLDLRWVESGGPEVRPPRRQGVGTGVMLGAIERQLGGKITFDWNPGGLVCHLSLPRSALFK